MQLQLLHRTHRLPTPRQELRNVLLTLLSSNASSPNDVQEPSSAAPATTGDVDTESGGATMPSSPTTSSARLDHLDGRHKNDDDSSTTRGFCARYFSAKSFLLLVLVAVLLLVLPLVLPPLPPPPSMLLLVPVAMLGVLLVLALMPAGGRNDAHGPDVLPVD